MGELFLPGQKAKELLVDHTVGCSMESAFFSSPVRNTLGLLSVLLPDSDAGWAHILTGELVLGPGNTQAKGTIKNHLHNSFITTKPPGYHSS